MGQSFQASNRRARLRSGVSRIAAGRVWSESLPLRDAFSVLFFVSVGMLFDPYVLIAQPLQVAGVVAIVLAGKTLAAVALVLAFGYPLNTALVVGASLAQIGSPSP